MEGHQEQQFKSTDIHASKAGAGVEYFKQNQPTRSKKKLGPSLKRLLSKKVHLLKKDIPLVAIIIPALIIVIIIIVICIISIQPKTDDSSNDSDAVAVESDSIADGSTDENDPQDDPDAPRSFDSEARSTLEKSGLAAFLAQYQQVIDAASDNEERADLYLERSDTLFSLYLETDNIEYRNQAIQDATDAERLTPSSTTANHLSNIYYALDDDTNGSQYEQLAKEREEAE